MLKKELEKIVTILKINFVLFIIISISLIGCIKVTSEIKENSSDNFYLLVVHGGGDHTGALLSDRLGKLYIDFFQNHRFDMNSTVIPSNPDDINASNLQSFTTNITEISESLNENSTFMILLNSHGIQQGKNTLGSDETLVENIIFNALKKGRQIDPEDKSENAALKPPFKRFIMFDYACYSDSFIQRLYNIFKTTNYNSIFQEGIYLASSDAADETFNFHAADTMSQMLFLFRNFKIKKCKNPTNTANYKSAYTGMYAFFEQEGYNKNNLELFEKCFSLEIAPEFFNTSSDFQVLLNGTDYIRECLKKIAKNSSNDYNKKVNEFNLDKFSFKIRFDVKDSKNISILPPITSCQK